MKKKYFWDEHPILFGTILFCGGFVLSLALQKNRKWFCFITPNAMHAGWCSIYIEGI